MLTLDNLKPMRLARDITRPILHRLTGLDLERLRALELREAEPWYDEALILSRALCADGILPLVTSGSLTDFAAVDAGIALPTDLALWRSGQRVPLSLALRAARRLGLADPADLASTPLTRQIWDVLSATERHPEAAGWCAWCQADIVSGEEHSASCLPHNLWGTHPLPEGAPTFLLRPQSRGLRERGVVAYGLAPLRLRARLSQAQAAREVGIHTNHYARVERAELALTPRLARKLALLFGVDPAVIYARPGPAGASSRLPSRIRPRQEDPT